MKKFIYLFGMMLLSLNMMAQIDLNDKNWDTVFIENFSGNRSWSNLWEDQDLSNPDHIPNWICFADNLWGDGVTNYDLETGKRVGLHAYQGCHAIFETDNTLSLKSEFISSNPLHCGANYCDTNYYNTNYCDTNYYHHAPWNKYCHYCDDLDAQHPHVHYYSGTIETIDLVGYGYYEMKCKMPIHRGTHDAFWFWGDFGHYEEIDVFEHSAKLCAGDITKGFNAGIFYNADGPAYLPVIDTITNDTLDHGAKNYAHMEYLSSSSSLPLDEYHTYGCLWLPERIAWFFDGELFNEETDSTHIPQHPMWLKITHYPDDYSIVVEDQDTLWWEQTDEMNIDYVKAYRLKSECDTDAVIRNNSDFSGFNYKVKRSITMGATAGTLTIPGNGNYTMRAVESITIDGGFEVPQGTAMTLITQDCPQCSMEGVVPPEHNCGMDKLKE